jgi:hypothetical protein
LSSKSRIKLELPKKQLNKKITYDQENSTAKCLCCHLQQINKNISEPQAKNEE